MILASVGNNDLLAAILGYATILLGVGVLALVVLLAIKFIKKKTAAPAPVAEEVAPEVPQPLAPGSAGQVKLHSVPPKTAAMLMAIVADKMDKPLNELRFISIKEVR